MAGICSSDSWSADAVVVSADGSQLFATGCFEDSVLVFDRNPATGEIEYLERQVIQAALFFGPIDVAVSPDNANVYVAGQIDDAIAVFQLVPEPSGAWLRGVAAGVLLLLARRRRKA